MSSFGGNRRSIAHPPMHRCRHKTHRSSVNLHHCHHERQCRCLGLTYQGGSDPGLVDGDPEGHAVSQGGKHSLGVVRKVLDDGSALPSAVVLRMSLHPCRDQ